MAGNFYSFSGPFSKGLTKGPAKMSEPAQARTSGIFNADGSWGPGTNKVMINFEKGRTVRYQRSGNVNYMWMAQEPNKEKQIFS